MGLLRYIVQGFGWQVGSHVAREGIEALERSDHRRDGDAPAEPAPGQREVARLEKARAKEAERKRAELEAQLAELKRRAGK